MRYYKLIFNFNSPEDTYCCLEKKINITDRYDVCAGKIVEGWDNENSLLIDIANHPITQDYLDNAFAWLIVSEKFINVTKDLTGDSIQYLPINIVDENDVSINRKYEVANVIDVIDALNLENSVYDIFKAEDIEMLSVEKYALNEKTIKGHNIFTIKDHTFSTFVSEDFKKVIQKNKLTGFYFLEVKVI